MSTLFVNTIKPDSGSNVLISSSLTVSESLKVAGDFELSGSIKLGNADTDSIGFVADVSSSILPDADDTFDLGSTSKQWRHLHVSAISASGVISSSGTIIAQNIEVDNLDLTNQTFTSITASGTITASAYFGDGSNLTGIGISGSALDVINITASGISMSQDGDIIAGTASLAHLNMISGNAFFNQVAIGTSPDPTASYGFHLFSETSPVFIIEGDAGGGAFNETKVQFRARNYPASSAPIWSVGIGAIGDDGIGEDGSQGANRSLFFTDNISIKGSTPTLALQVGNPAGFGNAVGINTSQPTEALQVEGNISASGTGSFEHLVIVGDISGSVSASGTGSFQGGIDCIGNGVMTPATGAFGYISASGDVSISGTGSFEFLTVTSEIIGSVSASGTGSFQGGIDCIGDGSGMSPASGAFGYISTSGDIHVNDNIILSADGNIATPTTGAFGFISMSVDIADRDLILSSSGTISASFFAGDGRHLTNITTSVAPPGSDTQIVFNDNGSLGADAGLLYNKTTDVLSVSGSIIVGNGLGHVSASRVSASAGFEADTASTSTFGIISCSGDISASGGVSASGGFQTDGGTTSSFGYISCSGEITVSGLVGVDGSISASGTISGSIIKGQQVQAQVGNNLGFRFNLNDNSQINGIQYNTIGERAHLQIPSLPTSVTNPFTASATALVGGNLTIGGTATVAGTTTHNGILNAANGFQIGGVSVTATAAELNVMDGFGGTTDQLNSLIKTQLAEIEGGKSVVYDSDGAVKAKIPKAVTSVTLTAADSGTTLMPNAGTPQTFTLPSPTSGVVFNFIAASAQAHVLRLPTGVNQFNGFVFDFTEGADSGTNDATVGVTRISNQGSITLSNPSIGDNFQCVSDGNRWYVRGVTNDTPTLGTV